MAHADASPLPADALDRPLTETARRIVLANVDAVQEAATRLRGGKLSAEELHDFRVALRRLRSVLRAYRDALGDVRTKRVRASLDALADESNPIRDGDVSLAWLDGHEALLPDEAQPFAELVRARLEKQQRRGARRLARRLDDDLHATLERVRRRCRRFTVTFRVGDPLALPRARDELAPILHALATALERRLTKLHALEDETALHRARIAAKRLRYALEPLDDAGLADAAWLAPATREALGLLTQLQQRLGEIHDLQALARYVSTVAGETVAAAVRAATDEVAHGHVEAGDVAPVSLGAHAGVLERPLRARTVVLFGELRDAWLDERAATVPDLVRGLADRLTHAGGTSG